MKAGTLFLFPNLSDSSFGSLESTNADGLARSICETQRVDHPHLYPPQAGKPSPFEGGNLLRPGRLPPPSAGGGEGEGDQNRLIQVFITFVATAFFHLSIALVTADVFTPTFRAISAPVSPSSSPLRKAMIARDSRYALQ